MRSLMEIFWVALRLGLTSFGGPVAHLGYFHREYVVRRRWLDEASYAEIVALCQALPGPASSQVGLAIGLLRGGRWGSFAAWLGFTLPSAVLMVLFAAYWVGGGLGLEGPVRGLKVVALVVVVQALASMAPRLLPGWPHRLVALATLGAAWIPSVWTPLGLLVASALGGLAVFRTRAPAPRSPPPVSGVPLIFLALFFGLLVVSLGFSALGPAASFYKTGALVFGGGHVVLPWLQGEFVPDRVTPDAFLAGYGAAQALPGPLFTFAAYLGYLLGGLPGAGMALVAIFLPSFLLVFGLIPLWKQGRQAAWAQGALVGVNAAMVGLLTWTAVGLGLEALGGVADLVTAGVLGLVVFVTRAPAWVVVLLGLGLGTGFTALGFR